MKSITKMQPFFNSDNYQRKRLYRGLEYKIGCFRTISKIRGYLSVKIFKNESQKPLHKNLFWNQKIRKQRGQSYLTNISQIPFLLQTVLVQYLNQTHYSMLGAQPQEPFTTINLQQQENRQIILEFELKKIMLYGPTLGIYILPTLNQPEIWNGIIFVRHGFYKEGKFKFSLNLEAFPTEAPSLYFHSSVYHPLVDQKTGALDISNLLQNPWNYGVETMLYTLMNNFEKMFTNVQYLSQKGSFNSKAAKLFEEDSSEFALLAMKSVDAAGEQLGIDRIGTSLSMEPIPQEENEFIRKQLQKVCSEDMPIDQKIDAFLKTLLQ